MLIARLTFTAWLNSAEDLNPASLADALRWAAKELMGENA